MGIGIGMNDEYDSIPEDYPSVVYVLMVSNFGSTLTEYDEPDSFTLSEQKAKDWVKKGKAFRSYIKLERNRKC